MKHFNLDVNDAVNTSFAIQQATYVEAQMLKKLYPNVAYSRDIPVDTSANPYAASVTFRVLDRVGQPKIINGHADDLPLINLDVQRLEAPVYLAGLAYSFSLEEIGQAQMAGINLSAEGAIAARDAYEEFVDAIAFIGNTQMGVTGLYNTAGITTAAAGGIWTARTPDQVLADINAILSGVWSASTGIEMADTIRVPLAVMADLSSRRVTDTNMTVLQFVQGANILTAETGRALDIRGDRRLTNRMVAYKKDPNVLKLHIPMPLTFLPPQPRNIEYYVPGMARLAGLDIRRRGAVRYMDGVA